ncbi:MAG TPA: BrnT family toxin [Falsiroseomonas sp.]|nr:BrnT family toxin [Falsiroseomonas sp.]
MTWTWDPAKAAANHAKHGVSFDLAALVFDDPLALSLPDPHPEADRWRTIGRPMTDLPTLLLVVHTEPGAEDAPGRIISARRATRHERRAYEEAG